MANATFLGAVAASPAHQSGLPTAKAFAMTTQPGGGPTKDVLVVYCPTRQPLCASPVALLAPQVAQVAVTYDLMGRVLRKMPANTTNSCVYMVLPVGAVGSLIHVTPPPHARSIGTSSWAVADDAPTASKMVLQSALPYGQNLLRMDQDAHLISGAATGNQMVFYLYNFGRQLVTGTVSATVNASVIGISPTTWSLTVPPGGRAHFAGTLQWTGSGKAAVHGSDGGVQLQFVATNGIDTPAAPVELFFRVSVDLNTVKPTEVVRVVGASDPASWSHNIAPGGTQITSAGPGPGCVQFAFDFGRTPSPVGPKSNAWAYPQLSFNASDAPAANMDGVRFAFKILSGTPIASGAISHTGLFFDAEGVQYGVAMPTNESALGVPQVVTLLVKNTAWDHIGTPPVKKQTGPIPVADIARLALGVSLRAGEGAYKMAVCDLEWVRW